MKRALALAVCVVVFATGALYYYTSYAWITPLSPREDLGFEFRYLGCNDWPSGKPVETSVIAASALSGVTYSVSSPATCGLSAREPRYRLLGSTLSLSYDLYSPSGAVAACICEYRSEFHFAVDPTVKRVHFTHTGGE